MTGTTGSGIDWDEVWRNQRGRRSNTYQQRTCPMCGRLISESAYSGRCGNFKKHVIACEKQQKEKAK